MSIVLWKALTWNFSSMLLGFVIVFVLSGDIVLSYSFVLVERVFKVVWFVLHESFWESDL